MLSSDIQKYCLLPLWISLSLIHISTCLATHKTIIAQYELSADLSQTQDQHRSPSFSTNPCQNMMLNSYELLRVDQSASVSSQSHSDPKNSCLPVFQTSIEKLPEIDIKAYRINSPTSSAVSAPDAFFGKIMINCQNGTSTLSIGIALDDTTVLTPASCLSPLRSTMTQIQFLPYKNFVDQAAQVIDVQRVHVPKAFSEDAKQAPLNDYAILRLTKPITHLEDKALYFLSDDTSMARSYMVYGFNYTYKHIIDFNITQPMLYPDTRHSLYYGCKNETKSDKAFLFAKTADGYYLAGLHLPQQFTTIKKSLLFDTAQQQHIYLLKWTEILATKRLATESHMDAQCELGQICKHGRWLRKDNELAFVWYRQAAKRGHVVAQYNLGVIYDQGRGVQQDYAKAVKWYLRAAQREHASAQYNLGWIYLEGRSVNQNDSLAFAWIEKAAQHDHPEAQCSLGWMYLEGRGVNQNDSLAFAWIEKAAQHDHPEAQCSLGWMYLEGHGVKQDDRLAFAWIEKAAQHDHSEAQCSLGWLYEHGRGVQQNYGAAVNCYRKAAWQGRRDAQYNLGVMYDYGRGVQQNNIQSIYWYRRAAAQGDGAALCNLGVMYQNGQGVKQNHDKAVKLYRQAAALGDAMAQSNLTQIYGLSTWCSSKSSVNLKKN